MSGISGSNAISHGIAFTVLVRMTRTHSANVPSVLAFIYDTVARTMQMPQ